jgi:hypothetical protein
MLRLRSLFLRSLFRHSLFLRGLVIGPDHPNQSLTRGRLPQRLSPSGIPISQRRRLAANVSPIWCTIW